MQHGFSHFLDRQFERESPLALAVFRITFGVFIGWHIWRFMPYITEVLPQSKFFLTFDGFHWVTLLPQPWLTMLFVAMLVAAFFVSLGFLYRPSIILLWLGWSYVVLLGRGHYNNHSYLFALMAFLMCFVSPTDCLSIDGGRGRAGGRRVGIPRWQSTILRIQIVLVYFYAGVAKLSSDWLAGYPMRIWLDSKSEFPLIGPLLATDFVAVAMSWAGMGFDLLIGFALLARRTRHWALLPLGVFHLSNAVMWNIGVFPWFMLAATTIFFDSDWPRAVLPERWTRNVVVPTADQHGAPESTTDPIEGPWFQRRTVVVFGLGLYLVWQVLFPLRHFMMPGPPEWYGHGNLFAWRMLTVHRDDAVRIRIEMPSSGILGYVRLEEYMNDRQLDRISRMPKAYLRFAHMLRDEMLRNGATERPQVFADVKRRLNDRPFQELISPDLDLAAIEYDDWAFPTFISPPNPHLSPGSRNNPTGENQDGS